MPTIKKLTELEKIVQQIEANVSIKEEVTADTEGEISPVSNTCQHKNKRFSSKYDSTYCQDCREWLENNCADPSCTFCKGRTSTAELGLEELERKELAHQIEILRSG